MNVETPIPTGSPQRTQTPPSAGAAEQSCERIDFDRYVVDPASPVGYIDVVPPLYVCYLGHPYARAVEVAQVYEFDHAVGIVSAMAAGSRHHTLAG
ncbi:MULTISPECIES: hypothetical protein [Microbacterium]|uniref:Uncharacterized protein n=1 Tax=Microbacterium sufflavum TaxID=2851649 RepID=A0ABY4IG79_9MICO|nr:hypothetical protein [Microbacterium sufflavum]UPL10523.1 hypothetical protein KV394_05130 [Microbacterium sufflavum]